ncbi:MAG: hypothetical protein WCQ72_04390 [Eubacteriales bacterium]
MSEYVKLNSDNESCPAVGYQRMDVCVPVTVAPYAHTDTVKTKCCGKPVITSAGKPCTGRKNDICVFTVSQTICVEVPVIFGAAASVGDTYVNCLGASDESCDSCNHEEENV